MGPWIWVGCGEARGMLAGTAEEEPCQEALGLRNDDIPMRGDVLVVEKVPEPGHREVPTAPLYAQEYFQKRPSTSCKSVP